MLKGVRLYNIELLRLIAMLLIVCLHFTSFAVELHDYDFDDPNRLPLWTIRGLAYMGTNLFVIISAYFLCKSTFKTKSVLMLWAQVFFYSIAIYLIMAAFGCCKFNIKELGTSLLPIIFSKYWFVTCYLGMYILSPFLNKLINSLDKKSLFVLIIVEFVFFSVVPNLLFNSTWLGCNNSSSVVWFCVLYTIGAYIRNYVDEQLLLENKKKLYIITLLFAFLPLVSKITIALVTKSLFGEVIGSSVFYVKNSIILVPLSICFFLTFLTFKIGRKGGVIINYIASSVFSVYLISENPYLSPLIWRKVSEMLDPTSISCSLYAIIIPLFIFVCCIIIDQVRKLAFKIFAFTEIPQKVSSHLSNKIDPVFNSREEKNICRC